MTASKKLIFFGNERLATGVTTKVPVLKALIQAGYEITAVIAGHVDPVSRQKRALEIGPVAQAHGIPVILPGEDPDWHAKLKNHPAEAAILVAFGRILPKEVIDYFPKGIINIHPSLLPLYRGPTPIEMTILRGDRQAGVSLMKLVPKMDAGPIYAQAKIDISGSETKQELADELSELGAKLLVDRLSGILDGSLKPTGQDEAHVIGTARLDKSLSELDFSLPAEILEHQVRAYAGWPKSRTKLQDNDVIITEAKVVTGPNQGPIVLKCNPGYLEIKELIAPSGRTMSGADFARGYAKN